MDRCCRYWINQRLSARAWPVNKILFPRADLISHFQDARFICSRSRIHLVCSVYSVLHWYKLYGSTLSNAMRIRAAEVICRVCTRLAPHFQKNIRPATCACLATDLYIYIYMRVLASSNWTGDFPTVCLSLVLSLLLCDLKFARCIWLFRMRCSSNYFHPGVLRLIVQESLMAGRERSEHSRVKCVTLPSHALYYTDVDNDPFSTCTCSSCWAL